MTTTVDAEGTCACGAVRLKASGAVVAMTQCWCKHCQKETGGGSTNSLTLAREGVEVLAGETETFRRESDAGNTVLHRFCPRCANVLTAEVENVPFIAVRVGVLDDRSFFAPQMILFRTSAPAWARFPEGAQQFDTQPSTAA